MTARVEKEQRKQGLVIAVDLDGVVAEFVGPFLRFYNQKCNTDWKYEDITSFELWGPLRISKEEADRMVHAFLITQEFANLKPVEGVKSALKLLSEKHTLHVITSRVQEAEQITREWLTFHFPRKFTGIHFSHNSYTATARTKTKLDICQDLGVHVLVEDTLEYALQCSAGEFQVILLDYPWNQSNGLPQNVTRVKSWQEIVRLISSKSHV